MKKYVLSSAFVLILGASSYVIGGAANYSPPTCSGTWCTVYLPQGNEIFCCPTGACPNPHGASTACTGGSGGGSD